MPETDERPTYNGRCRVVLPPAILGLLLPQSAPPPEAEPAPGPPADGPAPEPAKPD